MTKIQNYGKMYKKGENMENNKEIIKVLKDIRKKMFGTEKVGQVFDILLWQDNVKIIDDKIRELRKRKI